MSPVRQPEETRQRILGAAFELFHSCSFKGTSVNQIVDAAGITKGALFHHFKGKNELGYAVVDELLGTEIRRIWEEGLRDTTDPVTSVRNILKMMGDQVRDDPEVIKCGCPVNNLSQEMSAVDEVFREKLKAIYSVWIGLLETAFRSGLEAGTVKPDVDPYGVSAIIVALFEGSAGLIKVHQDDAFIDSLSAGIESILEGLRP